MEKSAEDAPTTAEVICPRCEQGVLHACLVQTTGEELQVCEECEATWPASEVPRVGTFQDLTRLMAERGLSPLRDVLEVRGRPDAPGRSSVAGTWPRAPRPVLVSGTVTRHAPYEFFLDMGEERDGLVPIIAIEDDADVAPGFPAVGRTVDAVLLGHPEPGGQARLSIRPSDLARLTPRSVDDQTEPDPT